jgi:hypothetical protein
MEFVKVAEGDGVEVFEAVRRVERRDVEDEEGGTKSPSVTEPALVPFLPEQITEQVTGQVHKEFAGRQIDAISVSTTGVSVRVFPRLCEECGARLQDAHKFCPECGKEV